MGAYAGVDDVKTRWIASTLPPANSVIEEFLSEAAVIIDAEYPMLRKQVSGNKDLQERLRLVSARMVIRAIQNPDRVRQVQETTGPFSGGVTFAAETLGDMRLTVDDRAILTGGYSSVNRAFTIDTTPSCVGLHGEVCSLKFGANYCSCGSDINRDESPIFELGAS